MYNALKNMYKLYATSNICTVYFLSVMTWMFFYMGKYPDVQERIFIELNEGLGSDMVDQGNMSKLR